MAHRMMGKFANHIVIGNVTCMARLLDWKCVRTDEFNKLIPDTGQLKGRGNMVNTFDIKKFVIFNISSFQG